MNIIANELVKEAITGLEAESDVVLVIAGQRFAVTLIEHNKTIGTARAQIVTGSEIFFDVNRLEAVIIGD